MKALHRVLVRDLRRLGAQAATAAMVVACGVAVLSGMFGTWQALERARQAFYAEGRFGDIFASLTRAPLGVAGELGALPGVGVVSARVVVDVVLDVPGLAEPASGRIVGTRTDAPEPLNALVLRSGRRPAPGAEEVVASEAFATAHGLAPGDAVHAVIAGRRQRLAIVGIGLSPESIYEIAPGAVVPDPRHFGVLWMDEQAAAKAAGREGAFNDVAIALAPGARPEPVVAAVDAVLAPYGGRGAYTREDHASHRFISDEIAQNRISATWLPGVFFAVAAFLLAVTLGRLASQQRRQIGMLRAFGYGRGEVVAHYVAFALVIVGAGGAVGLLAGTVLGTLLTQLYREYYHFPALDFVVDARLLVAVAAGLVAVAVAGAAVPALRVARLAPVEAMRPPVPPAYRAGALMPGVPASARMVARGLARRPFASLATAAGIALGLALCVVGFHFQDALAVLLYTQFEVIQREDVEVVFRESLGPQAILDLARLPAVARVEGARIEPVRITAGPRTRRSVLVGMAPDDELRRLLDRRGRPVALPEDGVLMSAKLGELLAVRPGDVVEVDLLAGTRRSGPLRVAGFVDDWAGTSLWALPGVVDRMAGDGPRFTGARISAAPEALSALYHTLKEIPALAAVSLRAANLATFREILDRSFLASLAIDVAFACLIAFGLVYNGARVALAERATELATLRVLGFTRGETAGLLLGEQAVLTIVAIPLGIALGAALAYWLTVRLSTELYRVPFALHASTAGVAMLVTIVSAVASGALVGWRVRRFDLVGVLKARE
jgi:putative ABC transport system permease protein